MSLFERAMATESNIDSVVYTDTLGLLVQEASAGVYMVQAGTERLPDLVFQRGPHQETGVNGYTNEMLLAVLIHRTEILDGMCPSEFNTSALEHMRSALQAFQARTADRLDRQIEGTMQA